MITIEVTVKTDVEAVDAFLHTLNFKRSRSEPIRSINEIR